MKDVVHNAQFGCSLYLQNSSGHRRIGLLREFRKRGQRLLAILTGKAFKADQSLRISTTKELTGARKAEDDQAEYGLIIYEGAFYNNIGDEIQSMAAMRFLPRIDHLLPINKFDELTPPASGRKVKVIMNGYFTCFPDSWPPPDWIEPLFVSFHLTDISYRDNTTNAVSPERTPAEVLLSGSNLAYFKKHQPIGCRDLATVRRLRSAGIQAYFTGCMTLTLKSKWQKSKERIFIVDVDCDLDSIYKSMPKHLHSTVCIITHDLKDPGSMTQIDRYAHAHKLIMMYRSARLVVTSRLHCALPCLAIGTDVLFLRPSWDLERFGGLDVLLNTITADDIANGEIDWETPPRNQESHTELASRLSRACKKFLKCEKK